MNDLLSPSLAGRDSNRPIFSTGALFLCAFFGGGLCITALGLMNSHYLNRLKKDLPVLVMCLFFSLALIIYLPLYFTDQLADGSVSQRDLRIAFRVAAFLIWGLVVWLHRAELRAQTQFGITPRNPWIPAIIAILLSWLLNVFIITTTISIATAGDTTDVEQQETLSP